MLRLAAATCALVLAGATPSGSQETAEPPPAAAAAPADIPVVEAGAATRGGLVEGTKVVHVTTLADKGEGSLRAALNHKGPRVVVFDVAGVISLGSDLRIGSPYVTIAGQTASDPGVTLLGAQIRIATHDVVIQHISVFPVLAAEAAQGKEIDAISVYACEGCGSISGIRLENVSVGWAPDEIVGLWGKSVGRVTLRNSLIAEGLNSAGEEREPHSMGMLIGAHVEAVEVVGNLFASNKLRNPVVGAGASAFIANNFVYNPGLNSIHVYGDRASKVTRVSMIGNVVKKGPSTREAMTAVQLPRTLKDTAPGARFFVKDNYCCSGKAEAAGNPPDQTFVVDAPPVTQPSWTILPADKVWDRVLKHAGSRPAARSPNDRRIVDYVANGKGAIIMDPKEVGGYGALPRPGARPLLPTFPFDAAPAGLKAKTRLEAWLCLRHVEVGGPATPECSDEPAVIRSGLASK